MCMKTCKTCKAEKPLVEFHKSPRMASGVSSRCKICACVVNTLWNRTHPDKIRDANTRWRVKNRAKCVAIGLAWQKANRARVAATANQRRAAKICATPAWAYEFFIEDIYDLAARRTALKTGGVKWVVDHGIPLKSATVCGLHVERNLRVVPAAVNMYKSNKFSSDQVLGLGW
jgi:hypothetical protein